MADTLQWRYDERDGISNNWAFDCLLNRLFRRISKKTSDLGVTVFVRGIHRWPGMTSSNGNKFRITGPLWGEFSGLQSSTLLARMHSLERKLLYCSSNFCEKYILFNCHWNLFPVVQLAVRQLDQEMMRYWINVCKSVRSKTFCVWFKSSIATKLHNVGHM